MGLVCFYFFSLLSVATSVPEYYINGFGCHLTSQVGPWAKQMKIVSNSIEGKVYSNNASVSFQCPHEYGILVRANTTVGDDGWNSYPQCPNVYGTRTYNGKVITPENFPLDVEYMCLTHSAKHWYAGAFIVDEFYNTKQKNVFASSLFAGAYASENNYRSMQYSALSIILSGLIGVLSVMAPKGSIQRKIAIFLSVSLIFAAFVGLVVSIAKIRKGEPRPYSGRLAHAVLGYITLVIIPFTLILAAIQFYKKTFETLFKIMVTAMLLLTIATSAIALEGFYDVDRAFVISVSLILAILFVSAMLINNTATNVAQQFKENIAETNGLLENAKRRSTRTKKQYFY